MTKVDGELVLNILTLIIALYNFMGIVYISEDVIKGLITFQWTQY